MTSVEAHSVVRWFAGCGDRYVRAYLGHVDAPRLAVDKHYGLKLFFFSWAFERAGAPGGYRIAAVKAVSRLERSQEKLPALFKKFYGGKPNVKANPVTDPAISNLDIPAIVQMVRDGALREAFERLALKGVGPKLRAFFLRDLVTLLKAEPKLSDDLEAYLWCQPIDVWVRFAAEELCPTTAHVPRAVETYPLSGA